MESEDKSSGEEECEEVDFIDLKEEMQIDEVETAEDEEVVEKEVEIKKNRIMYTRDQLLLYKLSKTDTNLLSNLPGELLKSNNYSIYSSGAPQQRGGNNIHGGAYPHRIGHGGSPIYGDSKGRMDVTMGGEVGIQNTNLAIINRMGFMNISPPPTTQRPPPKVYAYYSENNEKVALHQAENPWKPSFARKENDDDGKDAEQMLIEDLCKKTLSILNKLTPENLNKLFKNFIQLPLENLDNRIEAVVSTVFKKAIADPKYSTVYASMVTEVCKLSQITSKIFRKKILDQCQKEFQDGSKGEEKLKALELKLSEAKPEDKELIKRDLEDEKLKVRWRSLGNVRFIGELYKLAMLTPKIMNECIYMLIDQRDEESLECLCKLLTTIGQKLDDQLREIELQMGELQRRGKPIQKWVPEPKFMDTRFERLKTMSNDKSFSSRIRFALLDVYELRLNGWKSRQNANIPKTIEEVQPRPNIPPSQQQQKKGDSSISSSKLSRSQAWRIKSLQKKTSPDGDSLAWEVFKNKLTPQNGSEEEKLKINVAYKLPIQLEISNKSSNGLKTNEVRESDHLKAVEEKHKIMNHVEIKSTVFPIQNINPKNSTQSSIPSSSAFSEINEAPSSDPTMLLSPENDQEDIIRQELLKKVSDLRARLSGMMPRHN